MNFEYMVIPAPKKNTRDKNLKTPGDRLAHVMTDVLNFAAEEGWEFVRSETLTVDDKAGRFAKTVERIETVLVFRRPADLSKTAVKTEAAQKPAAALNASKPSKEEPKANGKKEPVFETENKPSASPSLGGASRD